MNVFFTYFVLVDALDGYTLFRAGAPLRYSIRSWAEAHARGLTAMYNHPVKVFAVNVALNDDVPFLSPEVWDALRDC